MEDLMEGAAFLSARTGAPIVPIGIGGSDLAMPKGSAIPKPCTIQVVIGPAIPPPPRTEGGRVSRSAVPCRHRGAGAPAAGRLRRGPGEDRALLTARLPLSTGGAAPCGPSTRSRARPGRSGSRRASSCPSSSCPTPGAARPWAPR